MAAPVELVDENGIAISATNPLNTTGGSGTTAQEVQGNVAGAATDSGNPVKVGAKYNETRPTYTDGQRTDLQAGARGALIVEISCPGTIGANPIIPPNSYDGSAFAGGSQLMTGLALFDVSGGNYRQPTVMNNGANVTGNNVLATGLMAQLDDTTPTAISENQFGNLRMTAARSLNTSAKPDTLGGLTPLRVVTGTTGVIKASAGQLYTLNALNTNAAVRYLHLYNKATAPTLSTDTPVYTVALPASGRAEINLTAIGLAFSTGISWAYTTDDIAIPTTAGTSTELHFSAGYA